MLERCLYALEMAWHPWFNPATANCRLPFVQEQNRPLFTALFKHMQARSKFAPTSTSKCWMQCKRGHEVRGLQLPF